MIFSAKIIHGVLLRVEGRDAIVLLTCDQGFVEYVLPWKVLKAAGVTLENQPFELRITDEKTTCFPSARKLDMVIDRIKLDDERKRKLSAIVEKIRTRR